MAKSFGGKDLTDSETMRGRAWPCLRQFCVFLENRVGKLNELMRHLETADVRVIGLSIVDSVDFAMVRLIFNNTDRAREKLELSAFLFSESDVVGAVLPDDEMPLASICTTLLKAEMNIHHAYPLLYRHRGHGTVALFVDDVDLSSKVLREAGIRVITESDLQDDDELF